ncbi:hypothetical protein RJ639_005337 [Escallonia herrerae]|uniref:Uncharacterized protein n=1 Tax=Escallonia herrerae TaxID=1293975 RepID=A0AA88VZE2_9ASTE|nr:hypothetical protein RJ639_005337 [Escallonia herrerae]
MATSESSSPASFPETSSPGSPYVQMVEKSLSERLLGKYFDASEFGFDYEQSELWSPPISRRAYLSSPSSTIFSIDDVLTKLKSISKSRSWFKKYCSACFNNYLHNSMCDIPSQTPAGSQADICFNSKGILSDQVQLRQISAAEKERMSAV